MNRHDSQKSYATSLENSYSSRKKSGTRPATIITYKKRPRVYLPLLVADRREQLFGASFNFIDTTVSVARLVGHTKKS